jgi:hypothetical protein
MHGNGMAMAWQWHGNIAETLLANMLLSLGPQCTGNDNSGQVA